MAQPQPPLLQLNNVTAYKKNTKVMDQFSMTINALEHTAIIGPNGAGKSTLIQLLTHQIYPVAPKDSTPPIRVFGKDHWIVAELRKRIGIVSAEIEKDIARNLDHGRITGRDVVVTGFFSSMQLFEHHRVKEEMNTKASQALADIGASYLESRLFSQMSAGEKRRILVARALVTSPDMLVLDEPTTALDIVARQQCLRLIQTVARQGTTVIIVTHHIEEIIPEIDNIILLKQGQALFSGNKKEILTSAHLTEVYGHPLNVYQKNGTYRVELEPEE